MKIEFTFKSPDVVIDTIQEQCEIHEENLRNRDLPLSEDEIEGMVDEARHEMQAEAERWFRYGEYITVELDTETHIARVIPPSPPSALDIRLRAQELLDENKNRDEDPTELLVEQLTGCIEDLLTIC